MLELLDYRRRVFAMYARIRDYGTQSDDAFAHWRSMRDELFGSHPQSALDSDQREAFQGLNYYKYNPAYRVHAELDTDADENVYSLDGGDDGDVHIRQIGRVTFTLPNGNGSLGVFWVEGYGGGIFIPFRDATNSQTTYGGGRYLYDTIKGADLGTTDNSLVLDFNYAYHPSCYYNPRWVCPLAPLQNQLKFKVEAGEQMVDIASGN